MDEATTPSDSRRATQGKSCQAFETAVFQVSVTGVTDGGARRCDSAADREPLACPGSRRVDDAGLMAAGDGAPPAIVDGGGVHRERVGR